MVFFIDKQHNRLFKRSSRPTQLSLFLTEAVGAKAVSKSADSDVLYNMRNEMAEPMMMVVNMLF